MKLPDLTGIGRGLAVLGHRLNISVHQTLMQIALLELNPHLLHKTRIWLLQTHMHNKMVPFYISLWFVCFFVRSEMIAPTNEK